MLKGGEALICTLGSEAEKATRWRSLSQDKFNVSVWLTGCSSTREKGGMATGCVTYYVQVLNHLFRTDSARGEPAGQKTERGERNQHGFYGYEKT
jgi:hypothetical protein